MEASDTDITVRRKIGEAVLCGSDSVFTRGNTPSVADPFRWVGKKTKLKSRFHSGDHAREQEIHPLLLDPHPSLKVSAGCEIWKRAGTL